MSAVIREDKYTRYEAYVAERIPQIVMEREATHECLHVAFCDSNWTAAMSAAYQMGDTAELGRLVAAEVHNRIVERADDLASEEASERFDV